jgi:hypothetical protein
VFNIEYQQNRDYLQSLLNRCLAKPRNSPEEDGCDWRLLDYVTNLYWRGDNVLLTPLLQVADGRKDVILEIGTFYADLLDRRAPSVVDLLSRLSPEKQVEVCKMAGEDELSRNKPKLERVLKRLRAIRHEAAARCGHAITGAASG